MKIIDKENVKKIPFKDVEVGDVFQCGALTAIKTKTVYISCGLDETAINAVDLTTGCHCSVGFRDECIVKSATLVLE